MTSKPTIRDFHRPSFRGLWFILRERGTLKKLPILISSVVSLIFFIYVLFSGMQSSFVGLEKTSDLILSFFPNLLGFSLGGFAIVVGFTNTDLIKESTSEDSYSVYQLLNSIFALCIIFQVGIVVIAYIISWSIEIQLFNVEVKSFVLPTLFNSLLLLILTFGALYSLLLTPFIVINLFTLSQINNLFYTLLKMKENNNKVEQQSKKN